MDGTQTLSPGDASPSAVAAGVDDNVELTKLDPSYISALRLTTAFTALPFLILALIADSALVGRLDWNFGWVSGPVALLAIAAIIRIPTRRWSARGYQINTDRLRVARGIVWRSDTIVPFGRVQHIDVDQGPIERYFELATLTLHTAGNHNSSVHLPGLNEELAREMREEIRAHIKRESS